MQQNESNDEKIERWEDLPPVSNVSVLGELGGSTTLKETRPTKQEKLSMMNTDIEELHPTFDGRITSGQAEDPLPVPEDWTSDDPKE